MESGVHFVGRVAAISRLCVLLLQMIFNLVPDHGADAFNPKILDESRGLLDTAVNILLDGFHKWDAKYFLYIAEYGYQEEQMFAFFPMFPALLWLASTALSLLPLSTHSSILLAGLILNTVFFIGAAIALYRLTLIIYQNEKFAILSAMIFCFNPASIFFSSNYTEALYSFCVFQGLFHLESASFIQCTLYFIGASSTRSNGVVNVGFPVYFAVKEIFQSLLKSKNKAPNSIIWILFRTALISVAIFSPFLCFNLYGYDKYCVSTDTESNRGEWCDASFPIMYSYVQSAHWNVGFLRYYQLKKIPNILLATPCVILLSFGILHYLTANRNQIKNLGFFESETTANVKSERNEVLEFAKQNIFAHISHLTFLVAFGLCFMHVEVITRFIFSSSPLPMWIGASLIFFDLGRHDKHLFNWSTRAWALLSLRSKLLCCYCVLYIVIGTFMHVNFLPWT